MHNCVCAWVMCVYVHVYVQTYMWVNLYMNEVEEQFIGQELSWSLGHVPLYFERQTLIKSIAH